MSVHISEPARDGKANSELIDFLSTVHLFFLKLEPETLEGAWS